MNKTNHALLALTSLLLMSPAARSEVTVQILGNDALLNIQVPGPSGTPTYSAELKLKFNSPVNLAPHCLGASARHLDATARTDVQGRMPHDGLVIDEQFPILISISPPEACGLSFQNEVRIELRTENLVFTAKSPYRLYKSPAGGAFQDITRQVLPGSVRTIGSSGGFSDFVIVRDDRQDSVGDASEGYAALERRLDDPDIGSNPKSILLRTLAMSREAFASGDHEEALERLRDMRRFCANFAGDGLDNRWRAAGNLQNDEGELVSLINPIEFALEALAADQG
jgi:hypothetical protein